MIVAREFSRPIRLLVAAQPTRGLDVGSIEYIHRRVVEKRDEGAAVLIVSTELDEVLALGDRIAVMYQGRIVAILDPAEATPGAARPVHGRRRGPVRAGRAPAEAAGGSPAPSAPPARRPGGRIRDVSDDGTGGTPPLVEPSAPGEPEAGRIGQFARGGLVPFLAVFTALVIGAFVIVLSDQALVKLWASNPLQALGDSLKAVGDGYGALFAGALGSPDRYARGVLVGRHRPGPTGVQPDQRDRSSRPRR